MLTEEPKITINGVALANAQSMTIRVALSSFAMDLQSDGLGDDEHGKRMTALYLERLSEIMLIIAAPSQGDTL